MTEERKKISLPTLARKRRKGEPISWLTCYDYPTAYLQEQAGIEMILVGDSLGMTMLGYDSTLPVTMEDMIRHTQAVRRGAPNVFLIGDMPYMSYQACNEDAVRNAGRFMAEAGCDAIKLEGGREMVDRVKAITAAGIPVSGHLGLTPQSVSALGGFRLQGKGADAAKRIVEDAKILEEAGAFCVLLELVPDRVCKIITERSDNALIMGLGSGPDAHGQLLIYHDMFGLYPKFTPKMAKVFGNAGEVILNGLKSYNKEVKDKTFPSDENTFGMKDEDFDKLFKMLS
ncbi:MAG: 3-methyl-2-oxobutanoate hydroxymethyltransferase [Chloroflexi bacterium]|jgi:3-methyl-2-oxobutanoate hydroxymethyltransferase|nr:3-methyl-2-oxobutanoate hydroxymethyltransferase [Chloroflexota bacterium]MBT3670872.1 3-methyl-2-oxobutanoate hydroxymethyltransferase [Chloroflexota bacterium]MBT4003676.1 3-methyl-2-oxobutanoate hydroxymethyltransferase [Chloroflexota bacterium]MBT4305185.1 3-methyl-2-oxobutanoate hydroxymethyltransferase [Chloroflexota bacterium]MBT4534584.1 3-methyl-2-oxobutanoate hydroxymethyltransferase [Chloroflexota bacterium]